MVKARKLTSGEKARIAEKIMDIGNLVFAALVVGQVLNNRIDLLAAVTGMMAFGVSYFIAYYIMQRG
jgi:hypothetical protein